MAPRRLQVIKYRIYAGNQSPFLKTPDFFPLSGQFHIDKVTPLATGEASKVKVKVRVNIHGIFTVASAQMIEKVEVTEETKDEPMDVENGTDEKKNEQQNGPKDLSQESQKADTANNEQKDEPVRVTFNVCCQGFPRV